MVVPSFFNSFILRTWLPFVAILAMLSVFPAASSSAQPSGNAVYQSGQTAFGPLTNGGGCSSSDSNQLPSRTLADTLDDAWAASTSYDTVVTALFPDADVGNISPAGSEYTLTIPTIGVDVGITYMNMPNGTGGSTDLRTSTVASSWGSAAVAGDPTLLYNSDERMQDCSVKPLSLVSPDEDGTFTGNANGALYWNAVAFGGTNERNSSDSVLFRFSQPVDNFGAWFGDVESRDDGQGELAYIKLYDSAGNVLAVQPIVPNVVRPITNPGVSDATSPGDPGFDDEGFGCGDQHQSNNDDDPPNDRGDYSACGNHGTRFLGFTWATPDVSYFQVIVGDDDHCVEVASGCDSNTEHLSFVGPSMAANNPELVIVKQVTNDDDGTADPADFEFTLTWDDGSGTTTATHAGGDVVELELGLTYTLTEVAAAGYTQTSASCVDTGGGGVAQDAITASVLNARITCTFVNDDIPPITTTTSTTTTTTTSTTVPETSTTTTTSTSSTTVPDTTTTTSTPATTIPDTTTSTTTTSTTTTTVASGGGDGGGSTTSLPDATTTTAPATTVPSSLPAPETTTTSTSTTAPPAGTTTTTAAPASGPQLPFTGAQSVPFLQFGAGLIVVGVLLRSLVAGRPETDK